MSSRPQSSGVRSRSGAGRPSSSQQQLHGGSQAWSAAGDDVDVANPTVLDQEPEACQSDNPFEHPDGQTEPEVEEAHGCWFRFKRGVRAIWRTNMTEDTREDRELYIKTTLRELIVYLFFLIVLMVLAFGMTSSTMYYFTSVMQAHDSREVNFVYYENKLLGVPRLRQVKVRNDSCSIADDFKNEIKACYAMYSPGVEEKSPFGYMNSTAWNHTTEKELDGRSYAGQIASYDGGGYYVDLTRNRDDSAAIIEELFKGLWIDRGTRVAFVDFTVYNANINLFCVVKLVMEFPATGGAIPSSEYRTVKLLRYVEPRDYVVLICEIIFMLFICYYVVEEVIEIKRHKLGYFKSFWNWLDILVIIISLVCAGFNVYRTIAVGNKLTELLKDESKFPDFDFLSYWQLQFNNAIAITVFFAWVKIFKYISFNKTMTQLSSTLGACAKDLVGFAVMFFIIFFAFAQLGYLIFGTQVKDFREFQQAIFTLFRIILGDFDFHELENAHRVLGPIFFLLYVFFVFFVLINMFLAIINDTYSERAGKVMDKLNIKRDKIIDIQKAMQSADVNNDRQLDFEEWRAELKMRGYADGEIEAMFAKYDVDGDRVLDEEEQRRMTSELEGQKAALNDQIQSERDRPASARSTADLGADADDRLRSSRRGVSGGGGGGGGAGVSSEEFTVLARRVDRMEHSIGSIVSKIDAVLVKLDTMEKAKLRRRETMSKLLDSISENEAVSDEQKREQMEQLVREELERWESEPVDAAPASSRAATARGRSAGASRPGSAAGSGSGAEARY
uniref:Polycystin-2 n=1 Tax=Macrostomum lignano TaxID=282301 RepID=A0A1I8G2W2_9PLAT